MCGISAAFGAGWHREQLDNMVRVQHHRGPDAEGVYFSPEMRAGLGHNRLSIIDLSSAAKQPMHDETGRYWIVFNGEVYNYKELRTVLASSYSFRTQSDTEVLLAAFLRWGADCLERCIGMFAFVVWDENECRAFIARDRFGVKPLYYSQTPQGCLFVSSEIKALFAAGITREFDESAWASYLALGLSDHTEGTYWKGVKCVPPGHTVQWDSSGLVIRKWYDLASKVGPDFDSQKEEEVESEYLSLLEDSVRLRFRSDVPIGINLSGGVDSSLLLALVQRVQGPDSDVKVFTFTTGDKSYDELPWVTLMLASTRHPLVECLLRWQDVPSLARSVQEHQDEPFGGLPTIAYANLFRIARSMGVIVLLDGQGMDEQWAGYDYYGEGVQGATANLVQGVNSSPVRPDCLVQDFAALAKPLEISAAFPDRLRSLQLRDIRHTKIPRGVRFNDRISMQSSTELREPFLDHRLVELAFRQPPKRKIDGTTRKVLLRNIASRLVPKALVTAPKRPLQTPQREWLRGPLAEWGGDYISLALRKFGGDWLDSDRVESAWSAFRGSGGDNSFFVFQWINLGLMAESHERQRGEV